MDETGDFGEFDSHCPYYMVSVMLHDQSDSIETQLMTKAQLDAKLQHSYEQAITRQGRPLDAVFSDLERKHS